MRDKYKVELFSIPVNLNFGCPNREKDGSGGCAFCPEHGARAAQIADATDVNEQISRAIAFSKKRYKAEHFALYLQAYTSTFTSLLQQKKSYEALLALHDFKALYIGTRPDCLSDATLAYLQTLKLKHDVVIELGVQSMHDESLEKMQRGHDARCTRDAIERIKKHGLKVYAHVIIGLENETPRMWQESVQELVNLGVDGLKFHNLHVIAQTHLAQQYAQKPFELMGEYAYAEALMELLRFIPSSIPIIRLSTDTPKKELIAPLWAMSKGSFGEYITQSMLYRGWRQGDKMETIPEDDAKTPMPSRVQFDGTVIFWNQKYRDYYHPKEGAYAQAMQLFLKGSELAKRLLKGDVKLLDIGFGMGYNTFYACKLAQEMAQNSLHVNAIDQDRMVLKSSASIVKEGEHQELLKTLFARQSYKDKMFDVTLLSLEARYAITLLEHERYDIIFVDPFLESNNATLVTVDFFKKLYALLKEDGVLVASTALHVSQIGLRLAGFEVTLANREGTDIKGVIAHKSVFEPEEKGEPYRDLQGVLSDKEIEANHQKQFKNV